MLGSNQRPLPCESEACSFATVRHHLISAFLSQMARYLRRRCSPPFAPVVVKLSSDHGLRSVPSACPDLYSSGLWAGVGSPVGRSGWSLRGGGARSARGTSTGTIQGAQPRRTARDPAQTVPVRPTTRGRGPTSSASLAPARALAEVRRCQSFVKSYGSVEGFLADPLVGLMSQAVVSRTVDHDRQIGARFDQHRGVRVVRGRNA